MARSKRKRKSAKAKKLATHPGGRPSVWTKEVETRFFQSLEVGAPNKLACQAAGVGERTLYDRMSHDPEFVARMEQASATMAVECFGRILQAARGTKNSTGAYLMRPEWTAAARLLEGRFPEYFARRSVVGIENAQPGQPFLTSGGPAALRDDQLDAEILKMVTLDPDDVDEGGPLLIT